MSVLVIEGFDKYSTSGTNLLTTGPWASVSDATLVNTAAGGRTDRCLNMFHTGGGLVNAISDQFAPGTSSGVIGFAVRRNGVAIPADSNLCSIMEGGVTHLNIRLLTTGALQIQRGDGTVLATSGASAFLVGNWYYMEFKWTIHNSTGTYELRLDGTTLLSGSGADTQNGGTAAWNTIALGSHVTNTHTCNFDDLYLLDTAGSVNNNFLATTQKSVRVLTKFASTGDGTHADFTPSTGTDNGAMVDEQTPDGDTTYNLGTTVSGLDTYNYPALSAGGDIFAIAVNTYVRKTDAGARSLRHVIRSGSTDYFGSNFNPITTYLHWTSIHEEDPNTSAPWLEADIDSAEFGLQIAG